MDQRPLRHRGDLADQCQVPDDGATITALGPGIAQASWTPTKITPVPSSWQLQLQDDWTSNSAQRSLVASGIRQWNLGAFAANLH